jgi:phosphatidylinositol alpha-1,6-mannosyltransferase
MKALLIHDVFPPRKGGSGRWLYELYRRFPGGSVHAVAPLEPGVEEFDRTHDLPVTRIPLRFSSWDILPRGGLVEYSRAMWQIAREARRSRADVLHVGKALPEGFLAWMLKGCLGLPYVCYAHGEELLLARTSRDLEWMTRRALHGSKFVVANSRHTRGMLERDWGLPRGRVRILHPGVDTTRFVPAPPSDEVRGRLGWRGRTVILTVGALQKRKGQDMMIRALPAIRRHVPDVLYALAGEGRERGYLEGIAKELGVLDCVQMRGIPQDEELIHCYQQCDLFALANRQVGWDFEGFGIVLLEAQACAKPVLAGASGGTAETMRPGQTGSLVPCEQPEPLAAEVVRLLSDPALRAEMGAAGREWVVGHLDWEPLTRQALELFDMHPAAASPRRIPAELAHGRST